MNFFDTLVEAMDPEAFELSDYDRMDAARERLHIALGKLEGHYKVVEIPPRLGTYKVTADYGSSEKKLRLSKAVLGEFTEELLRHGGSITSLSTMSRTIKGAYVQAVVNIPQSNIEKFEVETGFKLFDPPTFRLA